MKIIDITQPVFSGVTFPGDPKPESQRVKKISEGSDYNLTVFKMCAHNGTHVDAPCHFIDGGRTIDEMPIDIYVGDCYVARHDGRVTARDAEEIMKSARAAGAADRILISGDAVVSPEAAEVFRDAGIRLIGNESQSVGAGAETKPVHVTLLGAGITLLEGIRLAGVEDGKYFLSCAPLKLEGSDGCPVRAYLIAE